MKEELAHEMLSIALGTNVNAPCWVLFIIIIKSGHKAS